MKKTFIQLGIFVLVLVVIFMVARVPQHIMAISAETQGLNLVHSGKTPDAIPLLQRAVNLDPGTAMYHNNLGWYLNTIGRSAEALPECQTAVRLSPSSASAYDSLGAVLINLKRYPEAINASQNAVRMKPSAVHLLTFGMALYMNGQRVDGRAEWTKAAASFDTAAANQANADLQQYPE